MQPARPTIVLGMSSTSERESDAPPREYVLGTGADELERLGLQHRLWADAAFAAWKGAAIGPGQRVLDVGCGPGYASLDLAELVQSTGTVFGVDESEGFVQHLREQARRRGLSQVGAAAGDVQELAKPLAGRRDFDLAYARWVLCFVRDPGAVVAGVAAALAPGGRFVIHDYFNYEAMTLAPRRESHARAVAATARSWRARGGDPDIAARLPRLLRDHGFRVEHLAQHARVARPGDSMWHWIASWWTIYVPKLVAMGELSTDDGSRFFEDFAAMRADTDFAVLPSVFEIIARK